MKAIVDKDICIGCGLCCATCEEVFRLNENGKSEAYGEVTQSNFGDVQAAVDSCPVSAISLCD